VNELAFRKVEAAQQRSKLIKPVYGKDALMRKVLGKRSRHEYELAR